MDTNNLALLREIINQHKTDYKPKTKLTIVKKKIKPRPINLETRLAQVKTSLIDIGILIPIMYDYIKEVEYRYYQRINPIHVDEIKTLIHDYLNLLIKKNDYYCILGFENKNGLAQPIGFTLFNIYNENRDEFRKSNFAEIHFNYTVSDYRKKGYGYHLMDETLKTLKTMDRSKPVSKAIIEIEKTNIKNLNLINQFKFKEKSNSEYSTDDNRRYSIYWKVINQIK